MDMYYAMKPKKHARIGMFHLEEAVLDVLFAAKNKGECIGVAEISKRSGIYRSLENENSALNDSIVRGLLIKLSSEDRIEACKQANNQRGWQISEREFLYRNDETDI